jgi:hypothetical protein
MTSPQDLAGQVARKSDQELLTMLTKRNDWPAETINAARAELEKRNVDVTSAVLETARVNTGYAFKDLSGLTKFLKFFLILGAVLGAVAALSGVMQATMLRRSFTVAEGSANDAREKIVGISQAALFLFTVVIFAWWVFRANRNVRALGANGLRVKPGWAVGYFFVPIICLWKPYQAMKELWRASQNPFTWQDIPASQILPGWWTLWIVSNLLARVSASQMTNGKTVDALQIATYVQIAADVLNIGLCLVAIMLVSQICSAQTNAAKGLTTGVDTN